MSILIKQEEIMAKNSGDNFEKLKKNIKEDSFINHHLNEFCSKEFPQGCSEMFVVPSEVTGKFYRNVCSFITAGLLEARMDGEFIAIRKRDGV